jgi:acyl-CoA thioesterase-1
MDLHQGWVALLNDRLMDNGLEYRAINASISGDTSAGGLNRLAPLLQEYQPELVIIELGGNDGLRGYPIDQLRANLQQMTELSIAQGAQVLLLQMEIPPNLGPRYTRLFRESFAWVADQTGAHWAPFILEDIAVNSALMQSDGIHPTAAAQPLIVENVWPSLAALLERSDAQ